MQNENIRSSELCLSCGLCCDGAMFDEVFIEPEELESVRAVSMEVITKSSRPCFQLPCILYRDGKCTIYETRFFRCRVYKCKLLDNYQKGQVSFGLASSQIQKGVQIYEKLRKELRVKEKQFFWQSISKLWETNLEGSDGNELRHMHAMLLLEILAFIRLLGKHFFDNGDERWLIMKTGFKLIN
jgi:Fe-S-cluster containining protein